MGKISLISYCARALVLVLGVLLLVGCVRYSRIPEVGGYVGTGRGYLAQSQIAEQLYDGGWVLNVPGEAHTHQVVLAECPDTPVVMRHIHNHQQAQQIGLGGHKHKGCYICPPQNSLVGRVLGY